MPQMPRGRFTIKRKPVPYANLLGDDAPFTKDTSLLTEAPRKVRATVITMTTASSNSLADE